MPSPPRSPKGEPQREACRRARPHRSRRLQERPSPTRSAVWPMGVGSARRRANRRGRDRPGERPVAGGRGRARCLGGDDPWHRRAGRRRGRGGSSQVIVAVRSSATTDGGAGALGALMRRGSIAPSGSTWSATSHRLGGRPAGLRAPGGCRSGPRRPPRAALGGARRRPPPQDPRGVPMTGAAGVCPAACGPTAALASSPERPRSSTRWASTLTCGRRASSSPVRGSSTSRRSPARRWARSRRTAAARASAATPWSGAQRAGRLRSAPARPRERQGGDDPGRLEEAGRELGSAIKPGASRPST